MTGYCPVMDFGEVISRRRMVRSYTTQPVDPVAVDRIVQAARRAPSAGFAQGQAMVVVTDADLRGQIAHLAGEAGYVSRGFDPWLSRAPVHIVLCTSRDTYLRRYSQPDKSGSQLTGTAETWPVPYWWVDAGACLQILLMAAVNEGLSAGFLGAHRLPGLTKLLDIPDDYQPLGVITIGHPAPDRPSGSLRRGRRPTPEVIHYNCWGQPSLD